MARIRTIKPEFFTSEDIVGLSPLARLLYISLWCEADREGRLVWKPKTFKLRYFPADTCNIEDLCGELVETGLVVLYGNGLAHIPKFNDHQHVNPRESASNLPDPDASARVATRQPRVNDEQARDSDVQVGREGKGKEGKEESLSSSGDDPKTRGLEERVAELTREAIETWNESTLVTDCGLASVRASVGFDKRKGQVRRMLRTAREICQEQFGAQTITRQFWVGLWKLYAQDDFFAGRVQGGRGHENWRPDFEFLTQEKNVLKLYDRVAPTTEARA